MKGKVAIEEAITMPELAYQAKNYTMPDDHELPEEWQLANRLLDVHGPTRLGEMDKHGVGMMVLSITSPGCQREADQTKSEALAKRANDYMADICAKNPTRFQGFASLSMHDPAEAAEELTRAVKELGLIGCMLNDCNPPQRPMIDFEGQSSGPDGDTMLFYDSDDYDIFWKTVQELDVPVYMHPRLASPTIWKQLWNDRAGWVAHTFSTGVSIHTLGLCGNGVFDRFPKVQFVIGHLGEGLPADIWRLDHWVDKGMGKRMKMKQSLLYYFKNNIHVTTSGHYCDDTLQLCMEVLGTDRVMYSIDTAYEWCDEGAKWWDGITWMSEADKLKIGRENAIKLFKLKDVPQTPVTRKD